MNFFRLVMDHRDRWGTLIFTEMHVSKCLVALWSNREFPRLQQFILRDMGLMTRVMEILPVSTWRLPNLRLLRCNDGMLSSNLATAQKLEVLQISFGSLNDRKVADILDFLASPNAENITDLTFRAVYDNTGDMDAADQPEQAQDAFVTGAEQGAKIRLEKVRAFQVCSFSLFTHEERHYFRLLDRLEFLSLVQAKIEVEYGDDGIRELLLWMHWMKARMRDRSCELLENIYIIFADQSFGVDLYDEDLKLRICDQLDIWEHELLQVYRGRRQPVITAGIRLHDDEDTVQVLR
jgi:hypothetical protein